MAAEITPGFRGATKSARPVVSVVTRSPFENFTAAPGVSRPFTSSTASVARSPETMYLGSKSMRAADAGGGCCADAPAAKVIAKAQTNAKKAKDLRGVILGL